MILVLIFFAIILVLSAITIILILSSLEIEIKNIYISNIYNKLNIDFTIKLRIYLLNKIKTLSIKIEKEKIKKTYQNNIKILKNKNSNRINKEIIKILLNLDYKIEKVNIKGNIGTEDAFLTSILVGAISIIIPILTARKIKKIQKYFCSINPLFKNNNIIDIKANIVINIKIKEIISNLFRIKRLVSA